MNIFSKIVGKDRPIEFKTLLEGFVKLNVLLFVVCIILIYSQKLAVEDYFLFLRNQALLLIVASLIAKGYEHIRDSIPFKELAVKKKSLFLGSLVTLVILYSCGLIFGQLPLSIETSYLLLYHLLLALTYWAVVIVLARSNLMYKLIELLNTCIEYKEFLRLFLIFNLAFFFIVLMILIAESQNKNLLEIAFIIFYFEISFIIFHIAVAQFVDLIWLPPNKKANNLSLLGICLGSVVYAVKFNIIDRKLIGADVSYDKFLLTAIVALILFWVFFTLLFHLEWKSLLRRKMGSK
jgi:hypothetical protein